MSGVVGNNVEGARWLAEKELVLKRQKQKRKLWWTAEVEAAAQAAYDALSD